jgi:hypothetical protein
MPVPLVIYGAAILGALVIATFFVASPQGQKAAKDTADYLDSLDDLLNKPESPEPEKAPKQQPLPAPPVPPNIFQRCPREKPECPCCKGEPHSEAQRRGLTISEEEFYMPNRGMRNQPGFSQELEVLLPKIRASRCRNLLPEPGTPCSQYYIVSAVENNAAKVLFENKKRENDSWKGKRIAHRVPRAAGGCPIGPGNLYPVPDECIPYEERLGQLQGRAAEYHRKHNPPPSPSNKNC